MHQGKLENSRRQKEALFLLKFAGKRGVTSLDIHHRTGSLAPGTLVSELRHNGHDIDCVYDFTNETGTKVYRYFYLGRKP